MAQPTASDVHVDAALSQISIAYKNSGYIADRVFPQIPVTKQSDKYHIFTKDFWFRNHVQLRTPGDTYPEGGIELSNVAYFADIFHLAYPLPDEVVKNQDAAVDLDNAGAEWLADQFMLNREAKIIADFFKTGVWGTDVTLSGTNQWSDYANSDPIGDIQTAKQTVHKNTGAEVNICAIGREVLDILEEHPLLLDKYKYTREGILSEELISAALKVPLIVGNAIENSAQEGATFSGGYMWTKKAMLLHVAKNPGLRVPTAGYTFVWDIDGGGLAVMIARIREENRDRDLLKGKHAFDQKVVGTDLGYFIADAVA